ncbi:hypothetical protein ALQ08_101201 [Pseudomonas syringae pv. delphinii]|uniref:Uncharacterized protein n=2 Tax=Pseudomonas syringae group genomosp. 3 TaxID=251701 RepID=A0A0P9R2Z1_9PSED|nr:hypothetical protein [Pseudomonas syringae group genomosp. 3]KPX22288.1 Uncharacterized protein ALO72_03122 [Pseudomonas syringae pv. delphinii]POD74486.1 hypothetical protein BKM17_16975 [Pseudomonas syringae group genomosp. 3]RML42828.1 hypothetical protein ALQ95_01255 [Pseudomonas syringae pv. ribicola]RMP10420.1 hypothetical protein ALQ28_03167 [Pseudomonas syringae pv. delphinii]RMP20281.1 hypothetical protein ALQ27_00545 [Pseudomonas syringae pv. delphinii]
MNDYTNPSVIAKQHNATEIKEKIRAFLVSELSEWSIDPDKVYINGVNNPQDRLVIFSASLAEDAWNHVYENDAPAYSAQVAGLFTVAYSYADEHRLAAPDLAKVGELIGQLVSDLG